MSTRYPGGFINRSAPVVVGPVEGEGGSAPGVWTLEQAGYYRSKGLWPKPPAIGKLYDWGNNDYGQLGQGDTINRSSPVQVGALTTWRNIASSGTRHTIATQSNGTLWACGRNQYGQLGQTDVISRSSPVQVGALTTWLNISAGRYSSLAIKSDGTLWAFGRNNTYQLGTGNSQSQSSPTQIGALTTWNVVSSVGSNSSSAIKTDGTLWTWGDNSHGELGLNTVYSSAVNSPTQVGSLTTWLKISLGYHALSIKTNGTLWTWGYNNSGQLGLKDTINRSSPVQIGALTTWASVSVSSNHSLALKTDGTFWAWGNNTSGQLGLNDAISRSSPVQIGSLASWSIISAASAASFAINTDGTLWSWGANSAGILGQNNNANYSSPVQVGLLNNWTRLGVMAGAASAIAS